MLLGYARVSKSDNSQDTAAQVSAFTSAGCKRVFGDKASGGRCGRPELHDDVTRPVIDGTTMRRVRTSALRECWAQGAAIRAQRMLVRSDACWLEALVRASIQAHQFAHARGMLTRSGTLSKPLACRRVVCRQVR